MKKLFISVPMRGRTEENIKNSMDKMHKIAEITFDQKLEVIQTWIDESNPEGTNAGLWYLGKSIELMAGADFFIGVQYCSEFWNGCAIESRAARDYGIPSTYVEIRELMPDAIDAEREFYRIRETAENACMSPGY